MPRWIEYQDMLDREGSDIAILLSPSQQYLTLYLASLINDNPGAFITDLDDTNYEEIIDFLDEYVNDVIVDVMVKETAPTQHTYWHVNAIVNTGNPILNTIFTTQIMNHYAMQFAAAITDVWYSQNFWLAAGTYVIDGYCVKSTAQGKFDFLVHDVTANTTLTTANFDLYSATTVSNFIIQLSFTLTEARLLRLEGHVTGKNAASSSYRISITCAMVRS